MDDQVRATPILPTDAPQESPFPWKSLVLIVGTLGLTIGLALIPADLVSRLGNYGYLGVFLLTLLASATLVLPSPTLGITYLAGKFLDPTLVGITAGLAAGIGEITGYLVGVGSSEFAKRNRYYPRIERYLKRWGVWFIFIMAVIPSPAFDLAGIAAGTIRMPFWRFVLACTLGKTIRFIGIAWLSRVPGLHWPF